MWLQRGNQWIESASAEPWTSKGFVERTDDERALYMQMAAQQAADAAAAQAAATKAANLQRWILDNAFLLLCQQHFGDLTKRGTKELLEKAFVILETDQKAAMIAFATVIGLDKELVRIAGDCWWDSCVWHDDADAIAGAMAYLGVS